MRFLADEGVERYLVEALRAAGHIVDYIAEFAPGMKDPDVLAEAERHRAVLVTNDKDFGEIVFQQRRLRSGVLLLRLPGVPRSEKTALLLAAVLGHGSELAQAFSVLAQQVLRVRRLSTVAPPDQ